MNSREVVRRTLTYERPERIAHSYEPSDFVGAALELTMPDLEWRRINEREWRRVDEWGNEWGRLEAFSKGEVVVGALSDLRDAETIPFPNFDDANVYESAKRIFSSHPDKWHNAGIYGMTFSIARKLRKMEQYLMDILLEPRTVRVLHDRIDEQIKHQITHMASAGADSVMIAEDWGTQTQLLINPQLWRQEYKPRFARLVHYAHSLGLAFFMHSCGQMGAIVPDLIDIGVDVLQFDQPQVHGLEQLEAWRSMGRVTFWCPVDIQKTLQRRDETLIRTDAAAMVQRLWRGEGGFIAGFYGDDESIGLDPKWQNIASEAFEEAAQAVVSQQ